MMKTQEVVVSKVENKGGEASIEFLRRRRGRFEGDGALTSWCLAQLFFVGDWVSSWSLAPSFPGELLTASGQAVHKLQFPVAPSAVRP